MPVLSPERETITTSRDSGSAAPRRGRRAAGGASCGGAVRVTAVVVAVLLGWVGLHHLGDLLPDWGNPFKTEEVDRTGPAVLKALADLHEYRAATGSYQVMVDIEKDAKYLPGFLKGERTLFLAQGSVDAGVDFSGLGARVGDASPPTGRSRSRCPTPSWPSRCSTPPPATWSTATGGSSTGSARCSPTARPASRRLYAAAEPKLRAAANESALVAKADENTTQMLTRLLGALGFDKVSGRLHRQPRLTIWERHGSSRRTGRRGGAGRGAARPRPGRRRR